MTNEIPNPKSQIPAYRQAGNATCIEKPGGKKVGLVVGLKKDTGFRM